MGFNTSYALESIIRDDNLQAREEMSSDHIKSLMETLQRKGRVPRVKVILIEDESDPDHHGMVYAYDGWHQLEAREALEQKFVPVVQITGTWQDARDKATSANVGQLALPRTVADKTKAVKMYLQDHPDCSTRAAAKHTDTSPKFVEGIRESMPASKPATTRTGLDGKTRKMPKKKSKDEEGESENKESSKSKESSPSHSTKTFDWKRFDTYWAWLVNASDALASVTGDKSFASAVNKPMQQALDLFNEQRKLTEKEE